jgi:hypothetical protein
MPETATVRPGLWRRSLACQVNNACVEVAAVTR